MTAMNVPVILGAVAKKPVTPGGEKCVQPKERDNSSFYKQLKISQKQKNLSGKGTNATRIKINTTTQKPGEQEVRVEDNVSKNNAKFINQAEGTHDAAINPEETVKSRIQYDSLEEMASDDEEILEVSVSFANLVILPDQMEGQSSNDSEPVSDTTITAQNPAKNELLSKVPVLKQEEISSLQIGIPVQSSDESTPQTSDAKAITLDVQNGQQGSSNINGSLTATGEQPITDNENNTMLVKSQTKQTIELSTSRVEEVKQEVKSGQMVSTFEKTVKEAPEAKQFAKELLPNQNGNPKAHSESGAETKQNTERDFTASSRTSPTTDVKKLIDFETHRLNASRLSTEPNSAPESQAKAAIDDGKAVLNALSRSDTDLFKTTTNTNVTDSRSLPSTREIMAQVIQKAELLFTNKLSELRIDLKPEFLGRLIIKVVAEEGMITARFIAESQQVKHMLESNLHTLRQNLESQGLRVDRTEVSVQLNNGGLFDGSEDSHQYLWEEGRFSQGHQREGPYGDNQYTGGYEELDPAVTQRGADYEYNENGSLNFLI
ncbi:MAG TPA: hypothetical protein DD791_00040 [Syntrophomonas sp.]|nr:hypothetical protein [Syntrophomonas sp.]